MKISIITATFNSEKTIQSCLQSVESQDYDNIEHIIIDGKSTDKTCKLLNRYAENNPRVTYISEKDEGIYDALNKGIKMAKGEFIGFLHSDDEYFSSQTISKIASVLNKNNVDGIYGDLNYISSTNSNNVLRYWKSRVFQQKLLTKGWMPPHPTLFLKKDVYDQHGLFDLSFKIAADYDYILRIFKDVSLRFVYIPEIITNMRIGGASSSTKNLKNKMLEDIRALRKNQFTKPYSVVLRKNMSKLPQLFKSKK